jgi:hypothetical protein
VGSDPTGSTDVTDGKWHHIALVLTGYSYQAFVDGEQDMSGTYNFSPDPDTGVFRIGTGDPTHTADYSGYVDELRISKGKARYTIWWRLKNERSKRQDIRPFFVGFSLIMCEDYMNG